mgnify:CR=1 FL=1
MSSSCQRELTPQGRLLSERIAATAVRHGNYEQSEQERKAGTLPPLIA